MYDFEWGASRASRMLPANVFTRGATRELSSNISSPSDDSICIWMRCKESVQNGGICKDESILFVHIHLNGYTRMDEYICFHRLV